MKRFPNPFNIVFIIAFSTVALFATVAFAFSFSLSSVAGLFTWKVAAGIITFILGIAAIAKYTDVISRSCIAVGALFTDAGLALADGKVDSDELKKVKDDFIAVKNLFKKSK
jgi:uncharacterized membrane protein